jgi:hypothetical protein
VTSTPQKFYWQLLEHQLPRDEWIPINEIYAIIEHGITFTADDFLPSAPRNGEPRWKRNVRNVLQRRKASGEIAWNRSGLYLLPTDDIELIEVDGQADSPKSRVQGRVISPEALSRKLRMREATGLAGEEWVMAYEVRSLREKGRSDLAQRVHRESTVNVASGYDVLSYTLAAAEKYIEVKTTALDKREFVITANELNAAQILGQSYWIYFVSSVYTEEPRLFPMQNPYAQIGKSIRLTPVTFRARFD